MKNPTYHPDPEINHGVTLDAIEAELSDLAAGYEPRWWMCQCGAMHHRGHFHIVGNHRCLTCGYVGTGGVMADTKEELLTWEEIQ